MANTRDDLVEGLDRFGGEAWLPAVRGAGGRQALGTDSLRKAEAWLDIHDGWGLFSAGSGIKRR